MGQILNFLILIFFVNFTFSTEIEIYQQNIDDWLNKLNSDLAKFNHFEAYFSWKSQIVPLNRKSSTQAENLAKIKNIWINKVCSFNIKTNWLTKEQQRKLYLLCRGPKFSNHQLIEYLIVLNDLAESFNNPLCLPDDYGLFRNVTNFPKIGDSVLGEPDLERQMKRTDLTPQQLEWIWTLWHDSIGPPIGRLFSILVYHQNIAAKNNGYHDIGEVWREELEMPNLEKKVFELYSKIEPLYLMLHAVIRNKLLKKYGPNIIEERGPIPAHLLGNMWAQDWSSFIHLLDIVDWKIDLNERLEKKNLTVKDMVEKAEDFYLSMRFPAMTRKFWKYSIFEKQNNIPDVCHGTAANLFNKDDFRILMCGTTTMEDFYVIHHELGHIQYYMAFQNQSDFFKEGTNSAFHESIGDAIMHGVYAPIHLNRIGLLTDEELFNKNTYLYLIFLQALSKIPEIPFSLIIDKFRWEVFRGVVPQKYWNKYYWELTLKYRGIKPPNGDRIKEEGLFDIGSKFHISDNTPYIRYFISSILQMQIYKSMCGISFYGLNFNDNDYFPLDKCDIYGSTDAGKQLLKAMQKGSSIKWNEALKIIAKTEEISTEPFLDYYKPVYNWLKQYIIKNNIYVGW